MQQDKSNDVEDDHQQDLVPLFADSEAYRRVRQLYHNKGSPF